MNDSKPKWIVLGSTGYQEFSDPEDAHEIAKSMAEDQPGETWIVYQPVASYTARSWIESKDLTI